MKKLTTYNIAVCLSGQSRTWSTAKENILNYFDVKINTHKNCKINVDFFIHTWDNTSYKNFNGTNIYPQKDRFITKQEIKFLKHLGTSHI